jgi:glycosyltransferase involved in cell wall biosynthesis
VKEINEEILFSIVIPTYNRAHILPSTIESVINQTYNNWELIIVDDGSTDNTKEVVNAIAEQGHRVKYLYQENAERSVARNNGINASSGDYICFLDSDDLFKPTHLEVLHQTIIASDSEEKMMFTDMYVNEKNTSRISSVSATEYSPEFFLKNSIIPARVCVHRGILQKFDFDPRCIVVEDTVLWSEIAGSYPIIHISNPTVIYNLHEENSVNVNKYNAFNNRLIGLKVLFNQKPIGNRISNKLKREQYVNCYFGIARHHALNERKINAAFYLSKSIFTIYNNPRRKESVKALVHLILNKNF